MSEANTNGVKTGMQRMWENLTPEQRKARTEAMVAGRRRAKARREREAALSKKNPASSIDTTLELTKKAAALLELCGGDRRQVERLLDIAELVTEDRI